LTGILRIEHSPRAFGTRQRIFFTAEPLDDSPPKQTPDEHAIQAKWVRLEDLDQYPLRGEEVREAFQAVADGAPIYPLELLSFEGAPWQESP
ncbi:MAG: hypothetical protein N2C14_00080, partial [Planctomycetales bacterium]